MKTLLLLVLASFLGSVLSTLIFAYLDVDLPIWPIFKKDRRYQLLAITRNKMINKLIQGKSNREDVIEQVKKEMLGLISNMTDSKSSLYEDFVNRVLSEPETVILLFENKVDKKTYKKVLSTIDGEKDPLKHDVKKVLAPILTDKGIKQMDTVIQLLGELLTPQFKTNIDGEVKKVSKGENELAVFLAGQRAGILKESATKNKFVECTKKLKKIYPSMEILSRSSGFDNHLNATKSHIEDRISILLPLFDKICTPK